MEEQNTVTQEPKVNPFEYVTITLAEYRELVTATARKQIHKEYKAKIKELTENAEKYRRWWHEEEVEKSQLRKNLDDAKIMIAEKLGVDPDEFLTNQEDGETDAESV